MTSPTIVLSGALCAGKTTLAHDLEAQLGARSLSARSVLIQLTAAGDRAELQEAGREVETRTGGRWLAAAAVEAESKGRPLVVDAARTAAQLQGLYTAFAGVTHIHLHAAPKERERRYGLRRDPVDAQMSFQQVSADQLERLADDLGPRSDLMIETTHATSGMVVRTAMVFLAGA
jgi:adenylosuccinate synthase